MPRTVEFPQKTNVDISFLRERGRVLRAGNRAETTQRGYEYDWRAFCAWTRVAGLAELPAATDTVELYVVSGIERGLKVSSVSRQLSAIICKHRQAGLASPVTASVHELLSGARRLRGDQLYQMRPLTVDSLRQLSEMLGQIGDARALRDRAIILIGFASALRACSLSELQLSDIEVDDGRLRLYVRHEKQDQQWHGRWIGIPAGDCAASCAIAALNSWLVRRGNHAGPLFTHVTETREQRLRPPTVRDILCRRLRQAGIDPRGYGAHSMRSGFVTAAGEAGASDLLIASHTGHKSMRVLRGYLRRTNLFKPNVCAMIGL